MGETRDSSIEQIAYSLFPNELDSFANCTDRDLWVIGFKTGVEWAHSLFTAPCILPSMTIVLYSLANINNVQVIANSLGISVGEKNGHWGPSRGLRLKNVLKLAKAKNINFLVKSLFEGDLCFDTLNKDVAFAALRSMLSTGVDFRLEDTQVMKVDMDFVRDFSPPLYDKLLIHVQQSL